MLDKLIHDSVRFDLDKADHVAAARSFHFSPTAAIEPPALLASFAPAPLAPNEHSLRQICTKLGPAVYGKGSAKSLPLDYIMSIPPAMRADNFNGHLQAANGSRWMVRGYKDTARAVLSGDYPGGTDSEGHFENTQYLKVVQSLVESTAGQFPDMRIVRSNCGPDDLNLKLIWKNVKTGPDDGGHYGIGVYVGNGETGNRKLKVLPLIQRTKCDNSIIVSGENSLELVHRGSLAAMRTQFKAAIGKAFSVAAEVLDAMIAAEEESIPDFAAVLVGLALKHNWGQDVAQAVAIGTEGKASRAGVVNGITYAAHTAIEGENEQVDMEILGGAYLVADGSLFAQAAKQYRRELAGI